MLVILAQAIIDTDFNAVLAIYNSSLFIIIHVLNELEVYLKYRY